MAYPGLGHLEPHRMQGNSARNSRSKYKQCYKQCIRLLRDMFRLRFALAAATLLGAGWIVHVRHMLSSVDTADGQMEAKPQHTLALSDAGPGAAEELDCRRTEPFHLPDDLKACSSPQYGFEFGRSPWTNFLISNPLEPGCWDSTNLCAPFACFPSCLTDENYSEMIKYWNPSRPGKRKIMVFQYGKVASTAIVKGLKLFANLTAAHVHASSHAKQWLQGLHVDLPVMQQGFALSQEWSLNPGLLHC